MGFWSRIKGMPDGRDGTHDNRRPLLDPEVFFPAIHELHGLPRMDWPQAQSIISHHLTPEFAAAGLACAARYWLEIMAVAAGDRYRVFEDSHFFILHTGGPGRARRITEAITPAWRLIRCLKLWCAA